MKVSEQIRVVVVDDEFPARQRLQDCLAKAPDIDVVDLCANGYEAITAIKATQPDVVFLDVQMPEISGFDVIRGLDPQNMPLIVFVTAYDEHALDAFEVHAIDYLLKPFDDARFDRTLARIRQQLSLNKGQDVFVTKLMTFLENQGVSPSQEPVPTENKPYADRLCVKKRESLVFINTAEVDYIKGAGVYVALHRGNREYLLRESLSQLIQRLDPSLFCRIHRSLIVNHTRIQKLKPAFNGDYQVILHDGTRLRLSRSYRTQLAACLGHPL